MKCPYCGYEESKVIDKLDGLLTLKGLRLIYERNKG